MTVSKKIEDIAKVVGELQEKQRKIAAVKGNSAFSEATKKALEGLIQSGNCSAVAVTSLIKETGARNWQELSRKKEELAIRQETGSHVMTGDIFRAKQEYYLLRIQLEKFEVVFGQFSEVLANLGSTKSLAFIIMVTAALSMLWLDQAYGLDFLGGNYYLSLAVGFLLMSLIDSVAIFIVTVLFSILHGMIENTATALKVHHAAIGVLGGCSIIAFSFFVVARMLHVTL